MPNNNAKNMGGLFSMCRRAGKLCMGMDMVKNACANGEACGVYVASDISEKTLKEAKYICCKNGVKLYAADMDMQQIADTVGKRSGILAVCDKGFNKKASSALCEIPIDPTAFHL